jgi:hypothetical protein
MDGAGTAALLHHVYHPGPNPISLDTHQFMVIILVTEEALELVQVRTITPEGMHTPPFLLLKEVEKSLQRLLGRD